MIDLTQDDNMEEEEEQDMGNESSDLEVVPSGTSACHVYCMFLDLPVIYFEKEICS